MRHAVRHVRPHLYFAVAILAASAMSGSKAEQIAVDPGQPLCADQESLAMLFAAAMGDSPPPAVACQDIEPESTAEVIERMPSGVPNVRVVKVKVTPPGRGPVTGYTFEVDRH